MLRGEGMGSVYGSLRRMVLESPPGTIARNAIDLQQFNHAATLLEKSAERFGWSLLNSGILEEIRRKKRAETLYILGSGSSVNALDNDFWERVEPQVSVGINNWTLHTFVPDIYAVEPVSEKHKHLVPKFAPEVNHYNHLHLLGRRSVLESNAIVICLAPRTEWENSQIMAMPPQMRARTYVYYRYTPVTRARKNYTRDLRSGIKMAERYSSGLITPDSGATLFRLISMAPLLGFREIVLVGIDLTTRYFWQEGEASLVSQNLKFFDQPMKGELHETLSTSNRPFTIINGIAALLPLLSERGVKIRTVSYPSGLTSLYGLESG